MEEDLRVLPSPALDEGMGAALVNRGRGVCARSRRYDLEAHASRSMAAHPPASHLLGLRGPVDEGLNAYVANRPAVEMTSTFERFISCELMSLSVRVDVGENPKNRVMISGKTLEITRHHSRSYPAQSRSALTT
jgi:hypothetical protein